MQDASVYHTPAPRYAAAPQPDAPTALGGVSLLWPALASLSLALATGAVAARLVVGPRFDGLLIFATSSAAIVLGLRRQRSSSPFAICLIPPDPASSPSTFTDA
jgi:hypothetical protein